MVTGLFIMSDYNSEFCEMADGGTPSMNVGMKVGHHKAARSSAESSGVSTSISPNMRMEGSLRRTCESRITDSLCSEEARIRRDCREFKLNETAVISVSRLLNFHRFIVFNYNTNCKNLVVIIEHSQNSPKSNFHFIDYYTSNPHTQK